MNKRFENKIAIVTGAAMGIGKAVAHRLGKEGATLALFDTNEEWLQKAVKEFEAIEIRVKGYLTDVSNEAQVNDSISQVEEQWKKIDILVHAAGIVGPTSTKITSYSTEEFDKIYQVNLKGTFLIAKAT